jgi:transposase
MNEGHSQKELYKAFKIYASTVNDWKKLFAETGSLAPKYAKEKKGKIDVKKLEAELERKPDLTLPELGMIFGCTKQSVHGALKKHKITRKKRYSPTKSNQEKK